MEFRRAWTPIEAHALSQHYGKMPTTKLAAMLDRTASAVHQKARSMNLVKRNAPLAQCEDFVRRKNADGWTDASIAKALGADRHSVTRFRKRLDLPSRLYGQRWRENVIKAYQRQLRESGAKNLGELRSLVFRQRAAESGWPIGLTPREAQILDLLTNGPLTREQICEGLGMRFGRNCLKSRRPGGTHLAYLVKQGFVSVEHHGRSPSVYSLIIRRRESA